MEGLDNATALKRFLFLGHLKCYTNSKRKVLTVDEINTSLQIVNDMARPSFEDLPYKMIKKIMENKKVPRNDECLMAIAYCIRQKTCQLLREAVYKSVHELLVTDDDLFKFVHYARMLVVPVTTAGADTDEANLETTPKGFGRGMRRVISQWYHGKTAVELANALGRHRGSYNWTHKDIIMLAHVKFGEDDEKLQIIKAMFNRPNKILRQLEAQGGSAVVTDGMNRLSKIFKLKLCESAEDGAKMFLDNKLEVEHIPSHFYEWPAFWISVVPHLTYDQLLKVFLTLHDSNFLKPTDDLAKKFSAQLGKEKLIKESNVQPLVLLSILNGYQRQKRYPEAVKANWYNKKCVGKYKLVTNDFMVTKLKIALDHSFHNLPKIGLEYFITVDLRQGNARRSVFNMGNINCMEAIAIIALGFVKREVTKVFAFTDKRDTLKIINLDSNDAYKDAYAKCEAAAIKRTQQSLGAPIRLAIDKKPKIFITIMDSVARICRKGLPDFEPFRNYKLKHPNSKYIVLNLARHQQDLHSYPHKGVLEICGLSPDTPRIIEAFVASQFS